MEDISSANQYRQLRDDWFEQVAHLVVNHTSDSAGGRSSIASALLRLTFGGGHLLGFSDRELCLPGIDQLEVTKEISRWRTGYIHPRIAQLWDHAWLSFVAYGRDSSKVPQELLTALLNHPVGRSLHQKSSLDLALTSRSPDALQFALKEGHAMPIESLYRSPMNPLDIGANHLAVPALLVGTNLKTAREILLPLEAFASVPDDDLDRRADRWLLEARRIQEAFLTAPGSWPGSSKNGVPPTYSEYVINRSGRQGHSTTGVVPGCYATAESEGALEALSRLAYAGGISVEVEDETLCLRIYAPERDFSLDSQLNVQYYYKRNYRGLRRLQIMAVMRMVLFDLMYLDSSNALRHHATFSIPLDVPVVDAITAFIGDEPTDDWFQSYMESSQEAESEFRAQSAEMRRFEVARIVRLDLDRQLTPKVVDAVNTYLSALDRTSAVAKRGEDHPALIELRDARTAMRDLINDGTLLRSDVDVEALSCLGPGRACVYIETNQDGDVTPIVSWVGSDGLARYKHFDCGALRFTARSDADWVELLRPFLAPMAALLDDGIRHLVLLPPTSGYQLPYHQALLQQFSTVSYAPSLTLLKRPKVATVTGNRSVVVGWPGSASNPLIGVEAELEVLARLYDAAVGNVIPRRGAYRVLHLAGHADAGVNEAQSVIHLGPAGDISGTTVLRDFRLNGTRLAVLSACSTGNMFFGDDQLLEAAPLDVCLQAVGVQSVIYTSRPVDDRVAFLFAVSLHAELIEGCDIWAAYIAAVASAREPSRASIPGWMWASVDAALPGWDMDGVALSATDDWLAFRLGGRHWE